MKYIIERTSNEPIGLEGLIPGEIHDYATCTKEFFNMYPVNWFNKNYTNIILVEGDGCPYYKGVSIKSKEVFLYEVNTLEEMNALIEKVGRVIIFPSDCAEGYHKLEIYDDYRE